MIKLVVNPETQAVTRHFDKKIVIIGAANSPSSDLTLPGEKLQDIHVKIVVEGGKCTIINAANDPFVTLNGLPFGKKTLNNQDLIQVGATLIRFEMAQKPEDQLELMADTHKKLPEILEKALSPVQKTPKTAYHGDTVSDYEQTSNILPEEEEEANQTSDELLDLIRQVEELESGESPLSKEPQKPEPIHDEIHQMTKDYAAGRLESRALHSVHRASLKDDYLRHLDDEQHHTWESKAGKNAEVLPQRINWKFFLKILIGILLIVAILSGVVYGWLSDQTEEEEIKAARGVADVVMALTYAQIKQIKPQNQNWSDPEFIKNNLMAVLAAPYLSLANFDTHGQFNNSPYILRIYTSSDLSQFLVIAQPAPSLSQWFIPKSSIVVDSNAMEMRKIVDVKALNRLLVNANTLDGINAVEISYLVKQGELIPFSKLSNKKENIGLYPPKALALIRPGAQNFIYNAPRYYPLGEDLMHKSLDLNENPFSQFDPSLLQQEIAALSKFSDLVLYSSMGLQHALRSQKALAAIEPQKKFLVAYLQFNSSGYIVGSHLVMDDPHPENPIAENKPAAEQKEEAAKENLLASLLASLAAERQQALEPLSEQMMVLLYNQNKTDQPEFAKHFQDLFDSYKAVNDEHQTKIIKKVLEIYQENPGISLSQFMADVKSAGLSSAVQENLKQLKAQTAPENILTIEEIAEQLQKIEDSDNWEDLDQNITSTAEMLKLERLPDPDKLISYQTAARSKAIQKLGAFLLTEQSPLPEDSFNQRNRDLLVHILQSAWIDELDANDYLNEFDAHTQKTADL